MENRGGRRKRKRPPQQSQQRIGTHDDLEQQLAAASNSLERNDGQQAANISRRLKRSRLVEPYDENRPGTSQSLNTPSDQPERGTPSPARANGDVEVPPQRANTPPAVATNSDPDDTDDVIFVGVLQPPQVVFRYYIVYHVLIWQDIHYSHNHPMNVRDRPTLPTVAFSSEHAGTQTDCRICLSDYEEGEQVTTLPCRHTFHSSCANQWLQQSPTCPMCRAHVH